MSLQILCEQKACPDYLTGRSSASLWSEGERGSDRECQRELWEVTALLRDVLGSQGNIWELRAAGDDLSHSPRSSDV